MRRKRCVICHKLTEKWQRVNQGSWHCYDGCYSTTGFDRRTTDGKPGWENDWKNLRSPKLRGVRELNTSGDL